MARVTPLGAFTCRKKEQRQNATMADVSVFMIPAVSLSRKGGGVLVIGTRQEGTYCFFAK